MGYSIIHCEESEATGEEMCNLGTDAVSVASLDLVLQVTGIQ